MSVSFYLVTTQSCRFADMALMLIMPHQVLDYQNCAHTLLPLISSAYALWFMGEDMMRMYK